MVSADHPAAGKGDAAENAGADSRSAAGSEDAEDTNHGSTD